MPKHVRFCPPTYHDVPLSPHDDAALTMLDLHRCGPASSSTGKRKFTEMPSTESRTNKMRLVSPNEDEARPKNRLSSGSFVHSTVPAPPFLDDDEYVPETAAKAKMPAWRPEAMNPLDLLSTVSEQMAPETRSQVLPSVRAAYGRQGEPTRQRARVLPSAKAAETRREPRRRSEPAAAAIDAQSQMHGFRQEGPSQTPEPIQGYKTYPNGSTYLGHFLRSLRHGFGICTYPHGHTYSGLWSEGARSGLGVMQYSDGERYEGHWKKDLREGKGVCFRVSGEVDVAIWKEGVAVYGVRWAKGRECAWRLVDGVAGKRVGLRWALEVGREAGLDGVP